MQADKVKVKTRKKVEIKTMLLLSEKEQRILQAIIKNYVAVINNFDDSTQLQYTVHLKLAHKLKKELNI